MALEQLEKVVALHDHVVEFEEGERLLAFQAHSHAVHGQHAIDGEVAADIAQEFDVFERTQPVVVVDHDGAGGAGIEAQKTRENLANTRDIGIDLLLAEQLPSLIAAGRVPDLGGAPAHQHDGAVPGLLQTAQQHDLHQAADVQTVGGGSEADVRGNHPGLRAGIETLGVRDLVYVAALAQDAQKIRLEWPHPSKTLFPDQIDILHRITGGRPQSAAAEKPLRNSHYRKAAAELPRKR